MAGAHFAQLSALIADRKPDAALSTSTNARYPAQSG